MSFWTAGRMQDTATCIVLPQLLRDMGNLRQNIHRDFNIKLKHFGWSVAEHLPG